MKMTEPLLTENPDRYVMFPIRYKNIWDMYKIAESAFWTAEELDLTKDVEDWEKLSDNDRYFIKHVLAFFAASDGIVNENLSVRFMNDVQVPEAKAFYGFQIAMENIHSETYSLLIDTYVKDSTERAHLLGAMHTIPCIKEKADWAIKWIQNNDASFATRLVAFACVEGIFFSGAFCAIFWLKERGVMPGLCISNEFISRDESLHTEFACMLYSMLNNKLSQDVIHEIVSDAVQIESGFITEALSCKLLGMNADLMKQYIKFVADRLLVQLGYEKLYNVRNPFHFMDRICLDGKVNFFEHRESNYSKSNVGKSEKMNFKIDVDDEDF
jgi:ribonucleotide reductase beta subunit family protein with ferritin-like domain